MTQPANWRNAFKGSVARSAMEVKQLVGFAQPKLARQARRGARVDSSHRPLNGQVRLSGLSYSSRGPCQRMPGQLLKDRDRGLFGCG
jgi:hypothetical protein